MNLHLFLDVVAWIWGILLTLAFCREVRKFLFHRHEYGELDDPEMTLTTLAILGALCWAWIIAG